MKTKTKFTKAEKIKIYTLALERIQTYQDNCICQALENSVHILNLVFSGYSWRYCYVLRKEHGFCFKELAWFLPDTYNMYWGESKKQREYILMMCIEILNN